MEKTWLLAADLDTLDARLLQKLDVFTPPNAVECLHVVEPHLLESVLHRQQHAWQDAEPKLKQQLEKSALPISLHHIEGKIVPSIHARAAAINSLGIICHHRRHSGLHPRLSGHLVHLMQDLQHDCLVLGHKTGVLSPKSILVALDMTEVSEHVLQRAKQLAKRLHCPLEVITIIDLLQHAEISDELMLEQEKLQAQLTLDAEAKMAQLITDSKANVSKVHYFIGQRDQHLCQQVLASQPGLVVMGQHIHREILEGNSPDHVLHKTDADLYLVAPQ
ncbi:universal stress protein [Motilimonas pumila]|uniref:Universal stress protein n=1 Tax=Motilimonas pumila TaxID=2303987 RepID=A0A418YDP2_9GAMM|nr:universal stress protein [Motilimonas pumila]RJG42658.1 universal stress protein [Motilimonas pumila]